MYLPTNLDIFTSRMPAVTEKKKQNVPDSVRKVPETEILHV